MHNGHIGVACKRLQVGLWAGLDIHIYTYIYMYTHVYTCAHMYYAYIYAIHVNIGPWLTRKLEHKISVFRS